MKCRAQQQGFCLLLENQITEAEINMASVEPVSRPGEIFYLPFFFFKPLISFLSVCLFFFSLSFSFLFFPFLFFLPFCSTVLVNLRKGKINKYKGRKAESPSEMTQDLSGEPCWQDALGVQSLCAYSLVFGWADCKSAYQYPRIQVQVCDILPW